MRRAFPLILLLALVHAPAAHASAAGVIRDCTDDGQLNHTYTQKDLRSALANLPSDVDEYTNCRDVIRAAQLAGGGGSGGTSGGSGPSTPGGTGGSGGGAAGAGGAAVGSAPGPFGGFSGYPTDPAAAATPAEREALAAARTDPAAVRATALGSSKLPAPLIVALAVGALGLLALGALDLRRRVVTHRGA